MQYRFNVLLLSTMRYCFSFCRHYLWRGGIIKHRLSISGYYSILFWHYYMKNSVAIFRNSLLLDIVVHNFLLQFIYHVFYLKENTQNNNFFLESDLYQCWFKLIISKWIRYRNTGIHFTFVQYYYNRHYGILRKIFHNNAPSLGIIMHCYIQFWSVI